MRVEEEPREGFPFDKNGLMIWSGFFSPLDAVLPMNTLHLENALKPEDLEMIVATRSLVGWALKARRWPPCSSLRTNPSSVGTKRPLKILSRPNRKTVLSFFMICSQSG